MRWTLKLGKHVPSYLVRTDTKRDKLEVKAGSKAIKHEEKLRFWRLNTLTIRSVQEIEFGWALRKRAWIFKNSKARERKIAESNYAEEFKNIILENTKLPTYLKDNWNKLKNETSIIARLR